ncbi:MAG: glycosyltransferase family 4 protein [Boseongicola sp.]|nr:glycosyltransferase family 4 protein [Boseongicola sp.]MDD9978750.1 glycosyltransferase family 4 protein [Boseongicola sp.]
MTDQPMTLNQNGMALEDQITGSIQTVVFWGTYDTGKPRTRILRDGLREIGVNVVEIHANIWEGHEDKSQIGRSSKVAIGLRCLAAYPGLIWRYLRSPSHDAVVVPYLGQFDVLVLRPFAWFRRRPLVWDMFISLYDTVVCDRKMARPRSLTARLLKGLEWIGCRAADRVLMDTPTHARRISELFGLKQDKLLAVAVGAEQEVFSNVPPRTTHGGPVRILFYGQLIPLHGIETILDAALSERGQSYEWHIIGTGQQTELVAHKLEETQASHVVWERWRSYENLRDAILEADICLGIFGGSDKAASVVPNKVYQALFAGRPVVTRRSPAMEEAFTENPGLVLVDPCDPDALLDGVEKVVQTGFQTVPTELLQAAEPAEIAAKLLADLAPLIERRKRYAQ